MTSLTRGSFEGSIEVGGWLIDNLAICTTILLPLYILSLVSCMRDSIPRPIDDVHMLTGLAEFFCDFAGWNKKGKEQVDSAGGEKGEMTRIVISCHR